MICPLHEMDGRNKNILYCKIQQKATKLIDILTNLIDEKVQICTNSALISTLHLKSI